MTEYETASIKLLLFIAKMLAENTGNQGTYSGSESQRAHELEKEINVILKDTDYPLILNRAHQ